LSEPVKSEVSGRVAEVFVGEGDVVKKGDRLVELNKADIQSQIDQESRAIEASRLKAERLRINFAREQQLLDGNLVPRKEYDDMQVDFELAENELEIERDKLANLKENLSKTIILAAHDGTILDEKVTDGAVITGAGSVSEGTTLMTVADLSHLEVSTEVSEIDVTKLTVGMPASLTFDALPDLKLEGQVCFISPSAEEKEDEKSVHIFPLIVRVLKPDPRIRVGLSAEIEVPVAHVDKALALPITAVFQEGDTSYVYVKQEGKYIKQEVETGIQDGKFIEIKSGLHEKDSISLKSSIPTPTKPPGDTST
jgi:RND family efflux transporter MFP subunit